MFCGKCGKENINNTQFCIHCGADLSGLTPAKRPSSPDMTEDDIDRSDTLFRGQIYKGKLLAGQYLILDGQPLGTGGMGEVWKAQDTELGLTVAIKALPPMLSRDRVAIENLKREATIGQQLSHPNICRLYGLRSEEQIKFLVMEFVDGKTLKEMLADSEDHKLSWQQLEPIAQQIAEALDYAHTASFTDASGRTFKGILHRDIKPANIMVTKDGVAKLMDFGIAREIHNTMSQLSGRTSQTPMYASPEQFKGQKMTVASDIYSFTAVLYECLAGFPYVSPHGSLEYQILQKEFEPLDSQSKEVNLMLSLGMTKDSQNRPNLLKKLFDSSAEGISLPEKASIVNLENTELIESEIETEKYAGKDSFFFSLRGGVYFLIFIVIIAFLIWFTSFQVSGHAMSDKTVKNLSISLGCIGGFCIISAVIYSSIKRK